MKIGSKFSDHLKQQLEDREFAVSYIKTLTEEIYRREEKIDKMKNG